ncbi:MAG: M15 family metallopeptidase [Fibromonadales bacterium]|nr:M15 family metallopeptidase [Fibromonadales bacterium]
MIDLSRLHPEVRIKAEVLQKLCRENRLEILITDTWRTSEEQEVLYAKGRTTPGRIVTNTSYPDNPHCWGVAFDFCRNVVGREYDNSDYFFEKVGTLGKSIGLLWGGDFKLFRDMMHFEHPQFCVENGVNNLIKAWGTPDVFRRGW